MLYLLDAQGAYSTGVAWNGLTAVTESPSGADATDLWADNIKYLNLIATEDKKGTIKCYTFPKAWEECNGKRGISGAVGLYVGQQSRKTFGFSCRTLIGNDTEGTDYGYKIYIVYGATASPSDEEYQTVNDNPNAIEFSYEFNTVPVDTGITGIKPCAIFEVKSTDFNTTALQTRLKTLEDKLYGTTNSDPTLPTVAELIGILSGTSGYKLTLTQGDDTTLSVTRGGTALANNADIVAGDVLTISVTGGTVTVNGEAFTSGNTYTVAGNTVVVSTST